MSRSLRASRRCAGRLITFRRPHLSAQSKIYRGHDGARQVFTQLLKDVPQARWGLSTVFADDVLYLEWQATSAGRHVDDGIDTFVFKDGKIVVQTVRYTVTPD